MAGLRTTVWLAALLLGSACAAMDTVKITIFELQDGTEVQALRFTVLEVDGTTTYSVTQIDGKKLKLAGAQVAGRRDSLLRLADLPDSAQLEVRQARETRAAIAAKADTVPTDDQKQPLVAAKLRENEASAAMRQVSSELALAEVQEVKVLADAGNLGVEAAKAEAEFEATPRERTDQRRKLAVEKARLRAEEKNARVEAARLHDRVDDLRKQLPVAQKRLDEAKAETARMIQQMQPEGRTTPAP